MIRYAHENFANLRFPKLNRSRLRLIRYNDATFGNIRNLCFQLGRQVFLTDKNKAVIPVSFKSNKSRRVKQSVLSAKVVVLAEFFEDAYALRSQIEQAIHDAVLIYLMMHYKSLFDIISKSFRSSEKQVMLNIHSARKVY